MSIEATTQQLGSSGHFIHGEQVHASVHEPKRPLINPASGRRMGEVAIAPTDVLDLALASAKEGFRLWSAYPANRRAAILRQAATLILQQSEDLARLESLNTGKPLSETREVDIPTAAEALAYFASAIETRRSDYIELPGAFAYTRREPLGVCLGIGAWNYPLQIACWKLAPALAAGNSMIFKPSEYTPATALKLAAILMEAGVPPGVFNVVQGDGQVAAYLLAQPTIAKVSLTGSVETGKKVMAAAGGDLKQVTMELGGKSPLIIFADADIKNAVTAALLANYYSCGQVCTNGTRVFVAESMYEKVAAEIAQRANAIRLGNPLDPNTNMGPVISASQWERVRHYIKLGEEEGARKLCGGEHPFAAEKDHPLAGGYYIKPVAFAGCTDAMTIVRQEIFGPVMSLLSFKDEDEVIARANDTPFGLAGAVFSQDIKRAHRVVAQLAAGTCWINNYNWTPIALPFGGYKDSGMGRENGLEALDHYSQVKSVYVELGDVQGPF